MQPTRNKDGLFSRTAVRRAADAGVGDRMNNIIFISIILILAIFTPLFAIEAPQDMRQFNVTCPAARLLPVLDAAYHECNKGFENGSCERFVNTFRQLLPEYDCQRSFDSTPTKNYIVPAIWLAGDGALEDYIQLLSRMASLKDKLFTDKWFPKATTEARTLFGSKEFQSILDGALAETYGPLSRKVEKELRRKKKP